MRIDTPEPGFFKLRLVRGGPYVAAEIRHGPGVDEDGAPLDRSWLWEAWIDGRLVAQPSPDPVASGVYRIWGIATPIAAAEHYYLAADAEWCYQNAPHLAPAAKPNVKELSLKDLLS